jgi:hypothetical protein
MHYRIVRRDNLRFFPHAEIERYQCSRSFLEQAWGGLILQLLAKFDQLLLERQ